MRRTYAGRVIAALVCVTEWLFVLLGASAAEIAPTGMFVGDDPRFPFVIQVEELAERPGIYLLRGMGRPANSQHDATPQAVEFGAIGRDEGNGISVRGALQIAPDGVKRTTSRVLPWYGRFDPTGNGWQLMLSPQHLISAARSGAAAARGIDNPIAAAAQGDCSIEAILSAGERVGDVLRSDPQTSNRAENLAQLQTTAQTAAVGAVDGLVAGYFQAVTSLHQIGDSSSKTKQAGARLDGAANAPTGSSPSYRPLPSGPQTRGGDYTENIMLINFLTYLTRPEGQRNPDGVDLYSAIVVTNLFLNPRRQPAVGTSVTPQSASAPTGARPTSQSVPQPGGAATQNVASPADPFAGRSLDDVLTALWGLGVPAPESTSVTLLTAPDAAHAWQVVRVTRLPDGRIEIVHYGGPPDESASPSTGSTAAGQGGATTPNSTAGGRTAAAGSGSPSAAGTGVPPIAGGTGATRSGESSTSVVTADGANRPGGNPPSPSGPGIPPPSPPGTMAPPPPPPGPVDPRSAAGRSLPSLNDRLNNPQVDPAPPTQPVSSQRSPENTSVVGADGRTAPPLLHQQQIDAARAALNRASGGRELAKDPKSESPEEQPADSTNTADGKAHPLNGTWVERGDGYETRITIRVSGNTVHVEGVTTRLGSSTPFSGSGTIAVVDDKGTYSATLGAGDSSTASKVRYELSPDGRSLTIRYAAGAGTVYRKQ